MEFLIDRCVREADSESLLAVTTMYYMKSEGTNCEEIEKVSQLCPFAARQSLVQAPVSTLPCFPFEHFLLAACSLLLLSILGSRNQRNQNAGLSASSD